MDCLSVWLYCYRLNRLIQILKTNGGSTSSQRSTVIFLWSHIKVNPKIMNWVSVMVWLNFKNYPVFCCCTISSKVSVFTHYLCTNFTHFCGRFLNVKMNGKNKKNRYKWDGLFEFPELILIELSSLSDIHFSIIRLSIYLFRLFYLMDSAIHFPF